MSILRPFLTQSWRKDEFSDSLLGNLFVALILFIKLLLSFLGLFFRFAQTLDKKDNISENERKSQQDRVFEEHEEATENDVAEYKKRLDRLKLWDDKSTNDYRYNRYHKKRNYHKDLSPEQKETINESQRQDDPLKSLGDRYEKYIGKQFEKKDCLVIYNGFIKGYDDSGVDIIVISPKTKTVNLVQCKNWIKKQLTVSDIKSIYSKLVSYQADYFHITGETINYYLDIPKTEENISTIMNKSKNYSINKTLYISNDKVVDLEIGRYLTMIKPNIFKYEDMKMVVKNYH
jgi:hypothetical protein